MKLRLALLTAFLVCLAPFLLAAPALALEVPTEPFPCSLDRDCHATVHVAEILCPPTTNLRPATTDCAAPTYDFKHTPPQQRRELACLAAGLIVIMLFAVGKVADHA